MFNDGLFEVHMYNDGRLDIYNTIIGTGHGEKLTYMIKDNIDMKPYISFKYVLYYDKGKKYIRFNIPVDDFTKCNVEPNILFQHAKKVYLKGHNDFEPCIPIVFSNEAYELADGGKVNDEITNILINIEL